MKILQIGKRKKHSSEEVVIPRPTEGVWFEVKPKDINQKLFQKKRTDSKQETTRQIILAAFTQMRLNPDQYGRAFETTMPKKNWTKKTMEELKEISGVWGDRMAYEYEQAFEWAQRIANGETWEDVCNKPDSAQWYRAVIWRDEGIRIVGGSRELGNSFPASDVCGYKFQPNVEMTGVVPLIVRYK